MFDFWLWSTIITLANGVSMDPNPGIYESVMQSDKETFKQFELQDADMKLVPGKMIRFRGRLVQGHDKATVSLLNDNPPEDGVYDYTEVPFHMRFDFKEDHDVVLGCHHNGKWEEEERHKHNLKQGDVIEIRLIAQENQFDVYLNHKHFAFFNYRRPLSEVRFIDTNGGFSIDDLALNGGNFPIPYNGSVSKMEEGAKILITARANSGCEKMEILLYLDDKRTIPFRLTLWVRGGYATMSGFVNGAWKPEMRSEYQLLMPDTIHEFTIYMDQVNFYVDVDGVQQYKYPTEPSSGRISRLTSGSEKEFEWLNVENPLLVSKPPPDDP
ncbi:hypothetical protein M3Y96_00324600 [Aphelenchoides besseyi]|nr:hypothetical protein M3Y96_00324600 [Aphelenchoides besseyi]